MVSRPEPSSGSASTSPHSSAASSETRSIASDMTAMMAASRKALSETSFLAPSPLPPSLAATAAAASACSQRTPVTWPRPRRRPFRRAPASMRSVAGPVGEGAPESLARSRTAATTCASVAGDFPAVNSIAR